MAREAPSRVDLYFEDFLVGMDDLEPDERGTYFTICCLIWKGKGRLKDDDRYLARQANFRSARAFRAVKASLIAKGKIEVADDGTVRQTRAESEYKLAVARYESAKERGGKGAEIRHGKPAKPLMENGGGSSPASSPASSSASSPALSRGSSYQQPPPTESESLAGKPESPDPRAERPEPASQLDPVLIDRLEETVEARRQTVVDLRGSVAGWHKALGHDGWLAAKLIELLHRDDVPKPFNWLASAVDGELRRRAGLARPPDPPPPPKPPDGFLGRAARLGFDPGRLGAMGVQVWERIAAESDAGRLDDEAVRAALAWCERHDGRTWRPGAAGQGSGA